MIISESAPDGRIERHIHVVFFCVLMCRSPEDRADYACSMFADLGMRSWSRAINSWLRLSGKLMDVGAYDSARVRTWWADGLNGLDTAHNWATDARHWTCCPGQAAVTARYSSIIIQYTSTQ